MAMSNAERQKRWRQRHPGERRGQPRVRMSGLRADLMLEREMREDLRRLYVERVQENGELRRLNEELTGQLESARAEIEAHKVVVPLPRRKRPQMSSLFGDDRCFHSTLPK